MEAGSRVTILPDREFPPTSLLTARITSRLATLASALALALAGGLVPAADARVAPKAAPPTLTIESKNCSIGPAAADRSATVTALALLGTTGDRVMMRFSVQARQGKTRWKSLLFKDPSTTKKWETTEAAGAGLKLTKTIPNLTEGYEYRVVVETRAIDSGGKVVTRTARKYVPCKQPLFTPTLALGKMEAFKAAGGDGLIVPVKNLGRLPSKPYTVTISTADTRQVLASARFGALKGGSTNRAAVALNGTCAGPVIVSVQEDGAAPEALTAEQVATVDCSGAKAQRAAKHRRG